MIKITEVNQQIYFILVNYFMISECRCDFFPLIIIFPRHILTIFACLMLEMLREKVHHEFSSQLKFQ